MKVAIITFFSDNYGTCLQAFALQHACEKMGCQCTVVKNIRKNKISKYKKLYLKVKQMKGSLLSYGIIKCILAQKTIRRKGEAFQDFRNNQLKTTSNSYKSLTTLVDRYDLFIAGSDMVWSEEFIQYADFYFLRDIPKSKAGSYAPSFGKGQIKDDNKKYVKKLLDEIKYLSCREHSGIKLINELTGRSAIQVCDPTLLFNSKQWKSFFFITEDKSDSILVNCFGGLPNEFKKSVNKIRDKLNAKEIRFLNSNISDLQNEWQYGNGAYGPIEFIRMVNDCKFTVVNGYHGLIFALIFEKPFLVLHRKKSEHWSEHENRMKELLDYLNLGDRYIYPNSCVDNISLDMDYSAINGKIEEIRTKSWAYLKDMVENSRNGAYKND